MHPQYKTFYTEVTNCTQHSRLHSTLPTLNTVALLLNINIFVSRDFEEIFKFKVINASLMSQQLAIHNRLMDVAEHSILLYFF